MEKSALQNSTEFLGGVGIAGDWEQCKKEEKMVGSFISKIHKYVGQTDEKWMCATISSHGGYIGFIGRQYCSKECCTRQKFILFVGMSAQDIRNNEVLL